MSTTTNADGSAVHGKRRADFPAAGTTVNAMRPVDPYDGPVDPQPATGPIADALAYSRDRLDRVEYQLGDLNGVLERLGYALRPVLTMDGDGIPEPGPVDPRADSPDVDRRSTVARRISSLGERADYLADVVSLLRNKALGLVEALELEGVAR